MFSKIAFFALLVATAHASGGYSSFSYGVSDPNTGDIKDQHEKRVGGNVVGKYSLLEADGTKRVVEYSADDATGFKAVVHKEPAGGFGGAAIGGHLGHAGALSGTSAHGAPLAGNAPLAHGTLAGNIAPFTAGSPLAHSSLGIGSPFGHSALANPLAYGNGAGLTGQSPYGNHGNPLGSSLGYGGRGAPTVSSYSHSIVHNGPDAYPNGGAYGRYGVNGYGGYGAHAAPVAGAGLAQANPWAAGAGLTQANPWAPGGGLTQANPWASGGGLAQANPWAPGAGLAHSGALAHANPWAPGAAASSGLASPLAAGAYGGYAGGLGYGNQLGW